MRPTHDSSMPPGTFPFIRYAKVYHQKLAFQRMKKYLFCLLLAALGLTSCDKFESLEDLAKGQWSSTRVEIGSSDVTAFNSIKMDLQDDLEFDNELRIVGITGEVVTSYTGDWIANDDKQEIILIYDNGTNEKYDVIDITKTSMTCTSVVDGVRREIEFTKE
jgi:hypothetical protein